MRRIYRCTCLTAILLRSATISLERFPCVLRVNLARSAGALVLDGPQAAFSRLWPAHWGGISSRWLRLSSTICVMASSSVRLRTIQGISAYPASSLAFWRRWPTRSHSRHPSRGRTIAGWVTPLSLTLDTIARISSSSPDLKGMVFEGVELVQLDIYDLFLATAGSLLRSLGFLRSGSGLHRWEPLFSPAPF